MTNMIIYLLGAALMATGFGLGMNELGISATWIGVVVLIIIGLGIMGAVRKTQEKVDPDA